MAFITPALRVAVPRTQTGRGATNQQPFISNL